MSQNRGELTLTQKKISKIEQYLQRIQYDMQMIRKQAQQLKQAQASINRKTQLELNNVEIQAHSRLKQINTCLLKRIQRHNEGTKSVCARIKQIQEIQQSSVHKVKNMKQRIQRLQEQFGIGIAATKH